MVLAYLACSLDGFIASEDGGIDWLLNLEPPVKEYYSFHRLMNDIDAVVMGSNTFRKVQEFEEWQYSKMVYVLSTSIKSIPARLEGKAELISGTPNQIVDRLSTKGMNRLYVDGGKTIQAFLKADLLDEIYICQIAKIIGGGIPLFGILNKHIELECIEVENLNSQMTMNHYRIWK